MSVVLILLVPKPAAAAPPTPAGGGGEPGAIDTLAGPTFCDGAAQVDPGSVAVRAVTVDRSGTVSALGGTADHELIAQAGGLVNRRNLPLSGVTKGADQESSGVMAGDGSGEIFVSKGTTIVHIGQSLPADDPSVTTTFVGIRALTADAAGNLYVADQAEAGRPAVVVRFLNRSAEAVTFYDGTPGQITAAPMSVVTVAGAPGDIDQGDGRPASQATIVGAPISLAVSADLLFVGAHGPSAGLARAHGRVRAVNLRGHAVSTLGVEVGPGAIATVAGGGPVGARGNGIRALAADLGTLPGIAADRSDNLYLADENDHRVRKVDREGAITTFAGTGSISGPGGGRAGGGFNGNNRPAAQAQLNHPVDVEVSPSGVVYIADKTNGLVRSVDGTGTIRAVIGSGLALSSTCTTATEVLPTPGSAGQRLSPTNPVADTNGSIYFLASGVGRVMRLDAAGTVTPLTDDRRGCVGTAPCQNTRGRPRVGRPAALALGPKGALYIVDGGDNRILVLNLGRRLLTIHGVKVRPGTAATVAGNGRIGAGGDGGPAIRAQIAAAGSITVDGQGNLFIADTGNGAVRQVDRRGIITSLLPPVTQGEQRCCQRPAVVAVGPGGNLYIGETGGAIWLLNRGKTPATAHGQTVPPGVATLVAGGAGRGIGGEGGPAVAGQFQAVAALAADGRGNLYVADPPSLVRRIDAAGTLTTAAGLGEPSFNGDGLGARLTGLDGPASVAFDRCGNLLIADANNNRLRRLNLTPTCPSLVEEGSGDFGGTKGLWLLVPATGVVAATGLVLGRRRRRHRRVVAA